MSLGYQPLTTVAVRKAAEFWADARNRAKPTASQPALDADAMADGQVRVSVKLFEEKHERAQFTATGSEQALDELAARIVGSAEERLGAVGGQPPPLPASK